MQTFRYSATGSSARWFLSVILLLSFVLAILTNADAASARDYTDTLPDADYAQPNALLMANGEVLAIGQQKAATYNFTTTRWSATAAPPLVLTDDSRLVNLANGTVLLTGGANYNYLVAASGFPYVGLPSVEAMTYDPHTGTWTKQAKMHEQHRQHSMNALADGRVLVAGGRTRALSPNGAEFTVANTEIYDPATNGWAGAAPMHQPRYDHQAVLLPDGRVLVAGGSYAETKGTVVTVTTLNSAEIYNPQSDTWETIAPMATPRVGYSLTILLDGTVLAVGGAGSALTSAERYDPDQQRWLPTSNLSVGVRNHTATCLANGNVVLAGGYNSPEGSASESATVQQYDTASSSFVAGKPLNIRRANHAAVLINEQLLLVGGKNAAGNAEIIDFKAPTAQCFYETGYCVNEQFLLYWQNHGQLPINGYPLSQPFPEQLPDGKRYLVQYFERVRMEYHPEAADPFFRVQLGQFGRTLHPADPAVAEMPGQAFFNNTGHNVPADFFAYWNTHGGLLQFGFPISEVFKETLEDGRQYEVQYFERARFERHPESADPQYQVLLGQFGRRILAGR